MSIQFCAHRGVKTKSDKGSRKIFLNYEKSRFCKNGGQEFLH